MSAATVFECDGCGAREYLMVRPYQSIRPPWDWRDDGGSRDFCRKCKVPSDEGLAARLKREQAAPPVVVPPRTTPFRD